jgi:hypothetical protein
MDCHHGFNVSASNDVRVSNYGMNIQCWHDLVVFNGTVSKPACDPAESGCHEGTACVSQVLWVRSA